MSRKRQWAIAILLWQHFSVLRLGSERDPVVIVAPPKLLERVGLIQAFELWALVKALYGLRQAPALWSAYRCRSYKLSEEQHAKMQNAFNKLQTESKPWVNLPNWQKKNFQDWQWYKDKGELCQLRGPSKLKASEASSNRNTPSCTSHP